jgi:hypothetical protein
MPTRGAPTTRPVTEKILPAECNIGKMALLRKFAINVGVGLFIVSTVLLHLEGNQD